MELEELRGRASRDKYIEILKHYSKDSPTYLALYNICSMMSIDGNISHKELLATTNSLLDEVNRACTLLIEVPFLLALIDDKFTDVTNQSTDYMHEVPNIDKLAAHEKVRLFNEQQRILQERKSLQEAKCITNPLLIKFQEVDSVSPIPSQLRNVLKELQKSIRRGKAFKMEPYRKRSSFSVEKVTKTTKVKTGGKV